MPRARGPIYREHFTAVGKLKWRCNICIGSRGGRGRAMTRKQARFHEVSRKHSLMVAAIKGSRGGRGRRDAHRQFSKKYSRGLARGYSSNYSSNVAATFKHPEIFKYVGNGKWYCRIYETDAMTAEEAMAYEAMLLEPEEEEVCNLQVASFAAVSTPSSHRVPEQGRGYWRADLPPRPVGFWYEGVWCGAVDAAEWYEEAESTHEFLDKPRRSEGNGGTTSTRREGTVFERNDDDNDNEDNDNTNEDNDNADEDEDDDNDNEDDEDDDNDAAFVENFLRCHDVDASRRERMRSFYKMPTDQKIQKIQEVIRDLRG